MTISEVLGAHSDSLMTIPGVIGVGEGRVKDQPSIQVLVIRRSANLVARLPSSLEGYPVDIVETGVIEAQADSR